VSCSSTPSSATGYAPRSRRRRQTPGYARRVIPPRRGRRRCLCMSAHSRAGCVSLLGEGSASSGTQDWAPMRPVIVPLSGRTAGPVSSSASGGEIRSAQEVADLCLAVKAVTAECAQRGELASLGPPGDRFWVDTEELGDLSGGQEGLGVNGAAGHGVPRATQGFGCPSWVSTGRAPESIPGTAPPVRPRPC